VIRLACQYDFNLQSLHFKCRYDSLRLLQEEGLRSRRDDASTGQKSKKEKEVDASYIGDQTK
jgi:hypothetical protein